VTAARLEVPCRFVIVASRVAVEREQSRLSYRVFASLAACVLMASTITAAAQAITVGATSSTSDAPIYIATKAWR